jgi:hypothetical protein
MGGGLMQLVAYGAQDIYLTGNPQITFFKVVYRRHTNFSMESIKQTFNGTPDYGNQVTCTISRNGDLISNIWLEHTPSIQLPSDDIGNILDTDGVGNVHSYVPNYGHALIKEVELEIGGQTIDTHTGQWMQAWSDLTEFNPTAYGFAERTNVAENSWRKTLTHKAGSSGNASNNTAEFEKTLFQKMSGTGNFSGIGVQDTAEQTINFETGGNFGVVGGAKTINNRGNLVNPLSETIYIPLQFWFCRNIGLALPLIALQYHEVKVKLEIEELIKLYGDIGVVTRKTGQGGSANIAGSSAYSQKNPQDQGSEFDLYVDYIYLDTDERRRFAQVSHEYLIEQIQYIDETVDPDGTAQDYDVNVSFNHPVKELIWFSRNTRYSVLNGQVPATAGGEFTLLADESNNNKFVPFTIDTGGNTLKKLVLADATSAISGELFSRRSEAVERQRGTATFLSDLSARKNGGTEPGSWQLILNGHDRFAERDTQYFTRTQVQDYHTGVGSVFNRDSVSVYSFALKPEEHQPSGTCNFSRIDNANLRGKKIQYPVGANSLSIYAVNYNVLRIMSGMGGLAYSN